MPDQLPPRSGVSPKIVKLSEPTMDADGLVVSELSFREPIGRDIRTIGFPLMPDGGFHEEKMCRMIAQLGNVLPLLVDAMPFADWVACASAVVSFLDRSAPKSSTATTNAPTSGVETSPM